MIIPQGKVLVRAGKYQGGKLPYLSYVGQIKPADIGRIVFWGPEGDDTTGDGTHATPYETFDKALEVFSTIQHKWILRTDLGVYDEAGPYITDPADRVYLDTAGGNDANDGLTAGAAVQTYGAAKTALTGSGRSVIHVLGSVTLSDVIDAPTQGEIGETLTYNAIPSNYSESVLFTGTAAENRILSKCAVKTGTHLAVCGYNTSTIAPIAMRSSDNGATWTTVEPAWTNGIPNGAATDGSIIVVSKSQGASNTQAAYSVDNGATWSLVTIVSGGSGIDVVWSGSLFVMVVFSGGFKVYTSPTGAVWTLRSASAYGVIATDGNGVVVNYTANGQISNDGGLTWAASQSLPDQAYSIAHGGNRWYAFTFSSAVACYTSDDPSAAWTLNTVTFDYSSRRVDVCKYSNALSGVVVYQENLSAGSGRLRVVRIGESFAIGNTSIGLDGYPPGMVSYQSGSDELIVVAGSNGVSQERAIAVIIAAYGNFLNDAVNMTLDSANSAIVAPSISVTNVTSEPVSGNAAQGWQNSEIQRCLLKSLAKAIVLSGNSGKISRSVIVGTSAAEVNGVAAAQDDIEVTQNVIIGGLALNNSGGTDKELIRDNIIEGGFAAASPVTVRSNIRGGATGVSGISKVSGVAPVFSDEVDYFLSRIAFEDTADSPLIARSVDYLYTYDSVVYKSDLGPHMAFIALVTTMYRRSFLLPKFSGDALNEDVQNSAKLMKSINGVPDVSNRPSARMEIVSWDAKSVDEKIRADVAYMERNRNTGCELFYDFEPGEISTVTIDGAHSAGTFEVSIIAQDIPVGTILEIDGKNRYVTQRYPRSGQATKLIIDEVLAGGLADAQAVPIMQIQGGGEYVFVPQDNRKNRRTFSRRRDAYKGMTFTFARQSL